MLHLNIQAFQMLNFRVRYKMEAIYKDKDIPHGILFWSQYDNHSKYDISIHRSKAGLNGKDAEFFLHFSFYKCANLLTFT